MRTLNCGSVDPCNSFRSADLELNRDEIVFD